MKSPPPSGPGNWITIDYKIGSINNFHVQCSNVWIIPIKNLCRVALLIHGYLIIQSWLWWTAYPNSYLSKKISTYVSLKTLWWYSPYLCQLVYVVMMISWRHKMEIFSVTGPLCGEFTGHQWITSHWITGHWWIPLTKASDVELWYFLWFVPE